jgi:hypothetical protein
LILGPVKHADRPDIVAPDPSGEHAPLPRGDVVFMHVAACFLAVLLGAWFVGASPTGRLLMIAGFACGVCAMLRIGRLRWGEHRAHWLTPISTAYLPLYILCEVNGLSVATDILVASYAGLGFTILVRGLRNRKWRILGRWPT